MSGNIICVCGRPFSFERCRDHERKTIPMTMSEKMMVMLFRPAPFGVVDAHHRWERDDETRARILADERAKV